MMLRLAELGTDHLLNRLVEVDYFGLTIRICEWVGEKEVRSSPIPAFLEKVLLKDDRDWCI